MAVRSELVSVERMTRGNDGGGGGAATWSEVGKLWVGVSYVGGGEQDTRGAVRVTAKWRLVASSADVEALSVTTHDRIVWGGEIYNIRERPRTLARRTETEIVVETGVAT